MAISPADILSKVEAWSKTPEGKKRIQAKLDEYGKQGRATTQAGSKIRTEQTMYEAAAKMISILQNAAREAGLPESLLEHFDALTASAPKALGNGTYVVSIDFGGDLSRKSLENDLGYNGVDNIIALFNNGAHANNYVYGWWNGHAPTGESVYRSGSSSGYAWVRSKKDREGLHFIQQAVSDFNGNYGADYGVTATAGDDYK